jgi:hypothetical protein
MGGATSTVLEVAAVAVSIVAPEVGAFVLGFDDAAAAVAAGYDASTVAAVGAATTGAASSAINTAATGGDIGKVLTAAAEGAAAGAVGSEVASSVGEAIGTPGTPTAPDAGTPPPTLTAAERAAATGAGGATTGFTKAELGGSNLQSALRSGAVGGITGAASSLLFPTDASSDTVDRAAASVGKTFLGQEIAQLLAPTSTTPSRGGTSQTAGAGGATARGAVSGPGGYGDTTTGGGGLSPGSQALSQVLNLGSPTSAYSDTGAGGEKTSPETGGKPQNVWNLASLRVKDETGGEV